MRAAAIDLSDIAELLISVVLFALGIVVSLLGIGIAMLLVGSALVVLAHLVTLVIPGVSTVEIGDDIGQIGCITLPVIIVGGGLYLRHISALSARPRPVTGLDRPRDVALAHPRGAPGAT